MPDQSILTGVLYRRLARELIVFNRTEATVEFLMLSREDSVRKEDSRTTVSSCVHFNSRSEKILESPGLGRATGY